MLKISLRYELIAMGIGLFLYVAFLAIAIFTENFIDVILSPMHLMQIIFSIDIMLGLLFLKIFTDQFINRFNETQLCIAADPQKFQKFMIETLTKFCDFKALIIASPFIAISICSIYFYITPTLPNTLFPVKPISILWIYFSLVEFSLIMLSLLGIGVWIGIQVICAFKNLSRHFTITVNQFNPVSFGGLKPLVSLILMGTIMYSIVVALAFPVVSYVVYYVQNFYSSLLPLPIIGLSIVVLSIFSYFVVPLYFIHIIIVKFKDDVLNNISMKIKNHFKDFKGNNNHVASGRNVSLEGIFLLMLYSHVEKMRSWPIDKSIMTQAFLAFASPVITFIIAHL